VRLNSSQRRKLFTAMKLDKKVCRGEITFVLAKRIGKVVWSQRVTDEAVHRALDEVAEPLQIVF
jgi:3-dehydroquinate synthetase